MHEILLNKTITLHIATVKIRIHKEIENLYRLKLSYQNK